MTERLPLDLYAEVTTSSGARFKWDANQAPGSRLRNFSFRTKIGEGFSDAGGQLARRIDQDYPDLNLVDTITVVGADGSVAYEGRLAAQPRDLSDTHSIGVTLAGWIAHAKDRTFTEVYVDRDMNAWHGMSAQRRAQLLGLSRMPLGDGQTIEDPSDSATVVSTGWSGPWSSPYMPQAEAWYDAGAEQTISRIAYGWKLTSFGVDAGNANFVWLVRVSEDAGTVGGSEDTASLRAAGPVTGQTFDPAARYRYGVLKLSYEATPAGADGVEYPVAWTKLAVYGNHALTPAVGEPDEPEGLLLSDVIRDIAARWCPELDASGVQDHAYVVQHCAFKDRTFPYDAWLELNKYALWHLGVWENKRLHFRPYDLTDYTWEIRTDDPGTSFSPQGPSTEDLFNGTVVTYTDLLTGIRNVLTPDDHEELADTSSTNPWNQHGIAHWDEITLSTPTLEQSALNLGAAALADRNRPKTPGTITVRGYIRDRAGNPQPTWKVRAGDTIAITNFPNDTPRLIVETDYDDEQKQIRIGVDKPFQLLDAYLDRVGNALGARGLA